MNRCQRLDEEFDFSPPAPKPIKEENQKRMSSSTSLPSFNKLLIRNMRRRYKDKLAHIPDEDIVQRHRYITQVLNTNLTRNPEYIKYLTGWKALPSEHSDDKNRVSTDQKNTKKYT